MSNNFFQMSKELMREMQDFEDDDLLEQSQQSKSEILSMLDRRQKDQEEADLEMCFNQLKEKTGREKDDRIEELAN